MSDDRLKRWRLVLGGDEADGTDVQLGREDRGIDGALEAVYGEKRGGLGASRSRRNRNALHWQIDNRYLCTTQQH